MVIIISFHSLLFCVFPIVLTLIKSDCIFHVLMFSLSVLNTVCIILVYWNKGHKEQGCGRVINKNSSDERKRSATRIKAALRGSLYNSLRCHDNNRTILCVYMFSVQTDVVKTSRSRGVTSSNQTFNVNLLPQEWRRHQHPSSQSV